MRERAVREAPAGVVRTHHHQFPLRARPSEERFGFLQRSAQHAQSFVEPFPRMRCHVHPRVREHREETVAVAAFGRTRQGLACSRRKGRHIGVLACLCESRTARRIELDVRGAVLRRRGPQAARKATGQQKWRRARARNGGCHPDFVVTIRPRNRERAGCAVVNTLRRYQRERPPAPREPLRHLDRGHRGAARFHHGQPAEWRRGASGGEHGCHEGRVARGRRDVTARPLPRVRGDVAPSRVSRSNTVRIKEN
jgi:hypothetical protein